MVTVYTKDKCQPCKAVKRALDKKGISYEEVSIENTPGARDMIIGLGYMQAPVVVTEDDHFSGYMPDRINALAARYDEKTLANAS